MKKLNSYQMTIKCALLCLSLLSLPIAASTLETATCQIREVLMKEPLLVKRVVRKAGSPVHQDDITTVNTHGGLFRMLVEVNKGHPEVSGYQLTIGLEESSCWPQFSCERTLVTIFSEEDRPSLFAYLLFNYDGEKGVSFFVRCQLD